MLDLPYCLNSTATHKTGVPVALASLARSGDKGLFNTDACEGLPSKSCSLFSMVMVCYTTSPAERQSPCRLALSLSPMPIDYLAHPSGAESRAVYVGGKLRPFYCILPFLVSITSNAIFLYETLSPHLLARLIIFLTNTVMTERKRLSGHSIAAFSEHRRSGNRWSWQRIPEPASGQHRSYSSELSASQSALTATPSFPEAIELAHVDNRDDDNELPSGLTPIPPLPSDTAQPSNGVAHDFPNTSDPPEVPTTEAAKPPPVRALHGWKWVFAGMWELAHTVRY